MCESEPTSSSSSSAAAAAAETGSSNTHNCVICGGISILQNLYGADACEACNHFFSRCVKTMTLSSCRNPERCDITLENTESCLFCKMNKCYMKGMQSLKVKMRSDYRERRRLSIVINNPPVVATDDIPWEVLQFKDCLLLMEQHYYQWLHFSKDYERHPENFKKIIREITYVRGTALQLIERSLVTHDVLWLHNCFFNPYSCAIPTVKSLGVLMLSLVTTFRDLRINRACFQIVKIKLALTDDVIIHESVHISEDIFAKMYELEDKIRKCRVDGHIILRNVEDPWLISFSQLFSYPSNFSLPGHTIRIRRY